MPGGVGSSTSVGRWTHARVVVVESKHVRVVRVSYTGDARVPRAEVAARIKLRERRTGVAKRLAQPRAIVAVRGDDNPLSPQRMPTFFPDHGVTYWLVSETAR
jgi:hypothetical protein